MEEAWAYSLRLKLLTVKAGQLQEEFTLIHTAKMTSQGSQMKEHKPW